MPKLWTTYQYHSYYITWVHHEVDWFHEVDIDFHDVRHTDFSCGTSWAGSFLDVYKNRMKAHFLVLVHLMISYGGQMVQNSTTVSRNIIIIYTILDDPYNIRHRKYYIRHSYSVFLCPFMPTFDVCIQLLGLT